MTDTHRAIGAGMIQFSTTDGELAQLGKQSCSIADSSLLDNYKTLQLPQVWARTVGMESTCERSNEALRG